MTKMINTEIIYCSDNLELLTKMPSDCIDLIYLDPPFEFDNSMVYGYSKTKGYKEYLDMMRARLIEIHRILAPSGSLYYHCDWRIEGYLQTLLDDIFGRENLVAKIIWHRSGSPNPAFRYFSNRYDILLFYGKTRGIKFNHLYIPYSLEESSEKYNYIEEDTGRHYRLQGLTKSSRSRSGFEYEFLGVTRTWRWPKERMAEEYDRGRIVQTRPGAVPMLKQYMDQGKPIDDIWTDIPSAHKQFIGKIRYPTEKPIELLRRIIEISSDEGDLVLDPFCGTGTTLDAAQELSRSWIGIDISPMACRVTADRLEKKHNLRLGADFSVQELNRELDSLIELPPNEFENWAIIALKTVLKKDNEFSEKIQSYLDLSDYFYMATGSSTELDFEMRDRYNSIPIIVKQKKRINAYDINNFATMLKHQKRDKGLYISFNFSKQALAKVENIHVLEGLEIIPVLVQEMLTHL